MQTNAGRVSGVDHSRRTEKALNGHVQSRTVVDTRYASSSRSRAEEESDQEAESGYRRRLAKSRIGYLVKSVEPGDRSHVRSEDSPTRSPNTSSPESVQAQLSRALRFQSTRALLARYRELNEGQASNDHLEAGPAYSHHSRSPVTPGDRTIRPASRTSTPRQRGVFQVRGRRVGRAIAPLSSEYEDYITADEHVSPIFSSSSLFFEFASLCGLSPDGSNGSSFDSGSSDDSDDSLESCGSPSPDESPTPLSRPNLSVLSPDLASSTSATCESLFAPTGRDSRTSEEEKGDICVDQDGLRPPVLLPARQEDQESEDGAAPPSDSYRAISRSLDLALADMETRVNAMIRAISLNRDSSERNAACSSEALADCHPVKEDQRSEKFDDSMPLDAFSPQSVSSNLLPAISSPTQDGMDSLAPTFEEEMRLSFRDAVADTIEAIFASSSVASIAAEAAFLGNMQAGLRDSLPSHSSLKDRFLDCQFHDAPVIGQDLRSGEPTWILVDQDIQDTGEKHGTLAHRPSATWNAMMSHGLVHASTALSPVRRSSGTMLAKSATMGIWSLAALLHELQPDARSGIRKPSSCAAIPESTKPSGGRVQ